MRGLVERECPLPDETREDIPGLSSDFSSGILLLEGRSIFSLSEASGLEGTFLLSIESSMEDTTVS
ncbi:MAG: hypothetical protein BWY64_02851 [bacterium ADurb.Bin363]|nr:MAG: hypothetical protein BWY64_02851 [bacterium ADurb.Bin363]